MSEDKVRLDWSDYKNECTCSPCSCAERPFEIHLKGINCKNLSQVKLPNGIKELWVEWYYDEPLIGLELPNDLKEFIVIHPGMKLFDCAILPKGLKRLSLIDGALVDILNIEHLENLIEITIPQNQIKKVSHLNFSDSIRIINVRDNPLPDHEKYELRKKYPFAEVSCEYL